MSPKTRSLIVGMLLFVAVLLAACQPIAAPAGTVPPPEAAAAAGVLAIGTPACLPPVLRYCSSAELHYHLESVARRNLPWAEANAAPAGRELSMAEQYYRATMSHLVSAAPAAPAAEVASKP